MGWSSGPVGWLFPGPPEQRGCNQKLSLFLETPGAADSTVSDEPFYHLPSACSLTSTCTWLLGEVRVGGG